MAVSDDLPSRRHLFFTMLTACDWRDAPAGPAPVIAGLRTSSAAGSASVLGTRAVDRLQGAAWESLRKREAEEAV